MIELRNKSNYNQNNNSIFLTQYNEENNPFSWAMKYSDGIKDIAVRLQDDVPITAEEMDCLGLRYMDALLIIIAFYLGSLFLSAAVPILIKTFIHGAKLTVYAIIFF